MVPRAQALCDVLDGGIRQQQSLAGDWDVHAWASRQSMLHPTHVITLQTWITCTGTPPVMMILLTQVPLNILHFHGTSSNTNTNSKHHCLSLSDHYALQNCCIHASTTSAVTTAHSLIHILAIDVRVETPPAGPWRSTRLSVMKVHSRASISYVHTAWFGR